MRYNMNKWFGTLLVSFILALGGASPGFAAVDFSTIGELTPGEQYRQLSLLMLVSGGVDPALLSLIQPILESHPEVEQAGRSNLALDDFVTPLVRIVDQEILLANAAQMFRFARQNSDEIQGRMTAIVQSNPILISMVDVNEIAADAIIIRNAIADSMEYSSVIDDPSSAELLEQFRGQTVYLRNMMEYNIFQEELAEITNQAILDLGGRLDAYQRMFNEDIDPDLVKRRVESAEIMNQQAGNRYEDQAMMRNTELLMMLILMESQVH
jgi:hypothetical protein